MLVTMITLLGDLFNRIDVLNDLPLKYSYYTSCRKIFDVFNWIHFPFLEQRTEETLQNRSIHVLPFKRFKLRLTDWRSRNVSCDHFCMWWNTYLYTERIFSSICEYISYHIQKNIPFENSCASAFIIKISRLVNHFNVS